MFVLIFLKSYLNNISKNRLKRLLIIKNRNKLILGGVLTIKQDLPINEQIRADKVQLIDENNQKLGIVDLQKALETAYDKKLDLVLVSMNSNPKVCKIMDYGKFRFEQAKKEKEARKKSKGIETKEIRITPNIDTHDFEFKCKNAEKFLKDGNKGKDYCKI